MNTSLTRSIGFWLLLVVSLAATAAGGWLIASQLGTMTTTLTDGTATGVEVYVGQSLVVVGAVLLGAGVIGFLLALGLIAVRSLIPATSPAVVEPIDWTAASNSDDSESRDAQETGALMATESADAPETPETDEDQNGSSGSTATATKISVK